MTSKFEGVELPKASKQSGAEDEQLTANGTTLTSSDVEECTETKIQDLESNGQITVHIRIKSSGLIRIWPCIKLRCQQTGKEAKFVHALHVGIYPHWMLLTAGSVYTLVFEKLDNHCNVFDVLEDIPEHGGLCIRNLNRNADDVYRLQET